MQDLREQRHEAPHPKRLRQRLSALARTKAQADNDRSFAQAMALKDFVASELTTLFTCDLIRDHR